MVLMAMEQTTNEFGASGKYNLTDLTRRKNNVQNIDSTRKRT